jgi:hypothetical protein
MSGVLESLANPLTGLAATPRSVQLAANTADGSTVWDAAQQYYANDAVFSSVNGGLYIYAPTSTDPSCVLGGSDPATAGAPWVSASTAGLSPGGWTNSPTLSFSATAVANAAITVGAGGSVTVPPDSKWLCMLNCNVTSGAGWAANDNVSFTFTGNGTGGTAPVVRAYSQAASSTASFGAQCVVTVGTGGVSITLTAFANGTGTLLVINPIWTLIRLQ